MRGKLVYRRDTIRMVLKAGILALVLLAAICATYKHVLTAGPANLIGFHDPKNYFVPISFFIDYFTHSVEPPLWNPLTYCGFPVAANPQSALFYPPNLIRSYLNINPTPARTQASMVILWGVQLWFAMLFTFLLARAHQLSWGASLSSAFSFGFSSLMVRRVCALQFLPTLVWLPLLLLFMKLMLDTHRPKVRIAYACAAGLSLGLAILAGYVHLLPYFLVALAVYATAYRVIYRRRGSSSVATTCVADVALLGVVGIVSIGAAATALAPFLELVPITVRAGTVSEHSSLLGCSRAEIMKKVLLYVTDEHRAEDIRGAGIVFAVLCLLSAAHPLKRRSVLFLLVFIALIDCAVGPPCPIASLLQKVSPVGMAGTARAFDVAMLPLAILAGIGSDAIFQSHTKLARRIAIGIGSCLVFWLSSQYRFGLSYDPYRLGHPHEPSIAVVVVPVLAIVFIYVVSHGVSRNHAFGVAILVFAEAFAWNLDYVPSMLGEGRVYDNFPTALGLEHIRKNMRGTDPHPTERLAGLFPCMTGYEPMCIANVARTIIGMDITNAYSRKVRHWDIAAGQRGSMFLKRFFWLSRQCCSGLLPPKSYLFPSATTSFLMSREGVPLRFVSRRDILGTALSKDTSRYRLDPIDSTQRTILQGMPAKYDLGMVLPTYRQCHAVDDDRPIHSMLRLHYRSDITVVVGSTFLQISPRLREYGQSYVVPSTAGMVLHLDIVLPDFATSVATISVHAGENKQGHFTMVRAEVISDLNDEGYKIRIVEFTPNSIQVEVDADDGPRLLSFIDAYYPGWHAYVDSVEVPILKCNNAFKAVVVPEGTHVVRFSYAPWRVYAGIFISVFTCMVAITLFVVAWRSLAKSRKGSQGA